MEIMKKIVSGFCKVILFVCVILFLLSFSVDGLMEDGVSVIVSNTLRQIPEFEVVVKNEKVNEFIKSPEAQKFIKEYVEPFIDEDIDISKVDIGEAVLTFIEINKEKIEEIIEQPIDMTEVEKIVNSEEMKEINKQYIEIVSKSRETVPVEVKNTIHTYNYFISGKFRILIGVIGGIMLLLISLINKSYHSWIKTLGKTMIGSSITIGIISLLGLFAINGLFRMMEYSNLTFSYKNSLITSGLCLIIGIIMVVIYNKVVKQSETVTSE